MALFRILKRCLCPMNDCLVHVSMCISSSGRQGQPALTAKARAPHPGPPLALEQNHLWASSPEEGFLPPADPLPVCVIEEKHNPTVSASLPPLPRCCPRALPRTDLGPPSVCWVKHSLYGVRILDTGVCYAHCCEMRSVGCTQSAEVPQWASEVHNSPHSRVSKHWTLGFVLQKTLWRKNSVGSLKAAKVSQGEAEDAGIE